jgi:hypothetical protein
MSLNTAEKKELTKLTVECYGKDGERLQDADAKKLKRFEELLAKAGVEPRDEEAVPVIVRNHKLSPEAQGLKERGGEYLGCEAKNFGTDEKPRMVIREYFYWTTPEKNRECRMIQEGREIIIGRTLSEAAFRRIVK